MSRPDPRWTEAMIRHPLAVWARFWLRWWGH